MTSPASARRRGRAPLGPTIFGGGALLVGVLAFLVAISDLQEGRDAEFTPVNAAFMPVFVTGMWVLFSAIFFVKQLVNPTADYPVAPEPEPAATEPTTTHDESDADQPVDTDESGADHADADPTDVRWRSPALLVLALVGYVLLLEPLGFMITSPLFFFASAMIFGSRKFVRDAIVAIALPTGIYLLFTQLLELSLPQGVLPW